MRFERELENLGGTWKISEELGKSRRNLENLGGTWKISEELGRGRQGGQVGQVGRG